METAHKADGKGEKSLGFSPPPPPSPPRQTLASPASASPCPEEVESRRQGSPGSIFPGDTQQRGSGQWPFEQTSKCRDTRVKTLTTPQRGGVRWCLASLTVINEIEQSEGKAAGKKSTHLWEACLSFVTYRHRFSRAGRHVEEKSGN